VGSFRSKSLSLSCSVIVAVLDQTLRTTLWQWQSSPQDLNRELVTKDEMMVDPKAGSIPGITTDTDRWLILH
jgi:hypothetical protein